MTRRKQIFFVLNLVISVVSNTYNMFFSWHVTNWNGSSKCILRRDDGVLSNHSIISLAFFFFKKSDDKLPGPSIKSARRLFSCTGAIDIARFPRTDVFFVVHERRTPYRLLCRRTRRARDKRVVRQLCVSECVCKGASQPRGGGQGYRDFRVQARNDANKTNRQCPPANPFSRWVDVPAITRPTIPRYNL